MMSVCQSAAGRGFRNVYNQFELSRPLVRSIVNFLMVEKIEDTFEGIDDCFSRIFKFEQSQRYRTMNVECVILTAVAKPVPKNQTPEAMLQVVNG